MTGFVSSQDEGLFGTRDLGFALGFMLAFGRRALASVSIALGRLTPGSFGNRGFFRAGHGLVVGAYFASAAHLQSTFRWLSR